jgi:hypothetical protein
VHILLTVLLNRLKTPEMVIDAALLTLGGMTCLAYMPPTGVEEAEELEPLVDVQGLEEALA